MEINPFDIPEMYGEAKTLLDYKMNSKDQNNYVYINVDKVSAYYLKSKELMEQITEELKQELFEETGQYIEFSPGGRNDMSYIFTDMLGIPESDITKYDKISISKDVMTKLYDKYRMPFISIFLRFLDHKAFSSGLKWYYENVTPIPNAYNNEGDRIGKIRASYNLVETYRLNTSDPNIQGVNKAVCDIITAPAGWVIVQVDSGQIEPKIYYSTVVKDPLIDWLIEQYDDVYFALSDYCLRESTSYTKENLYLHEGIDRNHRSTLKTLVNAGTYGSSLQRLKQLSASMYESEYYLTEEGSKVYEEIKKIRYYEKNMNNEKIPEKYRALFPAKLAKAKEDSKRIKEKGGELAEKFFSRVLSHPQRIKHEREIEKKINMGNREVYSPFGDVRSVYGNMSYIKNCFLNNPLQMAVSRLSAISVCKAFEFINSDEKLRNFVRYAFNKHDEDVFYVRKEVADVVGVELKKFREYEVDGWLKIKSDYTVNLDYVK